MTTEVKGVLASCENSHVVFLDRQQAIEMFGEVAILEFDLRGRVRDLPKIPAERCSTCKNEETSP